MTRKEAIIDLNALKFILDNDQYTDEIEEALDMAIEALEQPEPKKGKWIVHYECPKCGEITKDFMEYCPFCGADMREGETEC